MFECKSSQPTIKRGTRQSALNGAARAVGLVGDQKPFRLIVSEGQQLVSGVHSKVKVSKMPRHHRIKIMVAGEQCNDVTLSSIH